VKQIVVIPRNGYVNRLQSMASAQILANRLECELLTCWEPETAAPASIESIFSSDLVCSQFITHSAFLALTGMEPHRVEPYLGVLELSVGTKAISLAGLDRGEQHFMRALQELIAVHPEVELLVISSGGRFALEGSPNETYWDSVGFQEQRRAWYQTLPFTAEIKSLSNVSAESEPFIGLHLRYTDRSHQTPTRKQISAAIGQVQSKTGVSKVFIASDSRVERDYWAQRLSADGHECWWHQTVGARRDQESGVIAALADWRTLGTSRAVVFFTESTFGYEAAVATGNFSDSIGLAPSTLLSRWIRTRILLTNIVTAPKRRGWL